MFSRPSFQNYYSRLWDKIRGEILAEPDSAILGTAADELAEYYYSNNALQPLELDVNREIHFEHQKEIRTVPAHQRDSMYQSEGDLQYEFESVTLVVSIVPNEHISTLQKLLTSTFSMGWSPAELTCRPDTITRTFDIKGYGLNLDDDQVARELEGARGRILQWIELVKKDVEQGNAALRQQIVGFIAERRQKIENDKARLAGLTTRIKIPLKKKGSEAVKRIRVEPKPLVRRVKPSVRRPEEYVLDRNQVKDILDIIDNQCRQMERTPKPFEASQEEELRNIILVGLNGVFEGRATGETFSARGKTDIYLNIDKGNILICECKFWEGEQLYLDTIDQLLGYLTWRENYGIMITFSRRKEFSKVLEQIPNVTQRHPTYARGFRPLAASHFLSVHTLPGDKGKEVELHHLFYNLCVK